MTEWHGYQHEGQRHAVAPLVFFSLVLAWGWGWSQTKLEFSIPWWVDTPAVLGIYGALYKIFDAWAWRQLRFLHGLPDYSGDYDVIIKSSFDDYKKEIPGKLKIRQRWSTMLVRMETADSASTSHGGYLIEAPGEGHRLVYLYHNTPKGQATMTMEQHDGTGQLVFSADGQTAKGPYYTGRGRLRHGEIAIKKVS